MEDDPTPPFILAAPFDNPDADVVLRSSDGIDFRTHRVVLSLASGFFKQMFSLPQPNGDPLVPVIPMSESATLLDKALRFWYPGAEPIANTTLDELRDIIEVVIAKYDIQFAVPMAKLRLSGHLTQDPVGVFFVACRHEWKDMTTEAARQSLALPLRAFDTPPPTYLNHATAGMYYQLLAYHAACARAATMALKCHDDPDRPGRDCDSENDECPMDFGTEFSLYPETISVWLTSCLKAMAETLAATPSAQLDTVALLTMAREEASRCGDCVREGVDKFPRFVVKLQNKINTAISAVELKLYF
ncbi:hypothetical protein FB45DRAFT_58168 [Roridomyces roridus]|uniref:BTB domain-containing protein n=1 Tax=Roridomyces roridus TaxID=1738132 RepID=A0AAD7FJ33_9AGAR|nr:hypothetical protein FB45DRAFT_58168 [Roridomyces roridus]